MRRVPFVVLATSNLRLNDLPGLTWSTIERSARGSCSRLVGASRRRMPTPPLFACADWLESADAPMAGASAPALSSSVASARRMNLLYLSAGRYEVGSQVPVIEWVTVPEYVPATDADGMVTTTVGFH